MPFTSLWGNFVAIGQRLRSAEFQRQRKAALDAAEPAFQAAGQRVSQEADRAVAMLDFGPQQPKPILQRFTRDFGSGGQAREFFDATQDVGPQPNALTALRDRLQRGAVTAQPPPAPPDFLAGPAPGGLFQGNPITAGAATAAQVGRELPGALGSAVGNVFQQEVEAFRPVGEAVGGAVGEELARDVTRPAQLARVAGERFDIPGLRSIPSEEEAGAVGRRIGEAVGPEVLVPSNLIPIPFLDPAVAKLINFVGKAGTRVVRSVLQRLSRDAAEVATREGVEATTRASARKFANNADNALGGVPDATRAVPEPVGAGTDVTRRTAAPAPTGSGARVAPSAEMRGRAFPPSMRGGGDLGLEPVFGLLDDVTIDAGIRAGTRDIVGAQLERDAARLQQRIHTAFARTDPTAPPRLPRTDTDPTGRSLERLPTQRFREEIGRDFPRRVDVPTDRPVPRSQQDLTGEALESLPERRLTQGLRESFPTRMKFPIDRPVPRREQDQVAEVLERLSGEPDRVMPPTVRGRDIGLEDFQRQAADAQVAYDAAKEKLTFVRRAARDKVMGPTRLSAAKQELAEARQAWIRTRQLMKETEIRVSMEDIGRRSRAAGADDRLVSILEEGYEDSLRLVANDEALLTQSAFRQRVARVAAAVEGTPPGQVGVIANQRHIVETAMREQTAQEMENIAKRLDDVLGKELDGLTFVVPSAAELKKVGVTAERLTELVDGPYKDRIVVQHPEWFKGKSPTLRVLLEQAQTFQRGKLAIAEAMGYPIKAIEGPYLEQLWDIPVGPLESPVPRPAGKVSIAKEKAFGDYVAGLDAGLTPKDMSIGELIEHSSSLMDEAIGDAYERRLVLERFGTKGKRPANTGLREFSNPIYAGWSAPAPITNFVDQLHNPVLPALRSLGPVAAMIKGTVFGLADIGVVGTHLLDAVVSHGPAAAFALVNRGLRTMQLGSNLWLDSNMAVAVRHGLDGVNQGLGPSAVTIRGGTIVQAIPFIGKHVDKPIAAAIDVSARAQFGGVLRPIRNLIYEGNLLTLHLTGSDISQAVVRRTAANEANAWTGASRGAMTPGRRQLETVALTSFQMGRSELARLTQIAKALGPTATKEERILAATTLATVGLITYGLGSAVNMAFGKGPVEWNPAKGDWASIEVGGQKIPMISRRAVIRAIGKSFDILENEARAGVTGEEREGRGFADLGKVWAQVVVAKMNPGTAPVQSALGLGFEPDAGFQVGTLSGKGRFLNMLPMPPLIEAVVEGERSPLGLGLEFGGFNVFPTSASESFLRVFKDEEGHSYGDEPGDSKRAQANPKIAPFWEAREQELLARGAEGATGRAERARIVAAKEVEVGLPKLSQDFLDADFTSRQSKGPEWADAYSELLTFRANIASADFFEADEREGEEFEKYTAWAEIRPETFRDEESGTVIWDEFFATRDAAFAELAPDLQRLIETELKLNDPVAQRVEAQFKRAKERLTATPDKYRVMTSEELSTVRRFMDRARRWRTTLMDDQSPDFNNPQRLAPPWASVYKNRAEAWADEFDLSSEFLESRANALQSSTKRDAIRNREYDEYLANHVGTIFPFYPNLYRQDLQRAIKDFSFEAEPVAVPSIP